MTDPRAAERHATREAARRAVGAELERTAPTGGAAGGSGPGGVDDTGASPPRPKRPWRMLVAGVAVAVGIVAAGLIGFGAGEDDLSQQDIQQRQASFDSFVQNVGALDLDLVPEEEVDEAIASMDLPAAEKEQLKEQVAQGRTELAYITVWDTHDEDGDVVTLQSDGVSIDVTAYNNPKTLALPMPSSGIVNVKGKFDGGGGITVAVRAGDIEVWMPWMQANQQGFGLPVRPGP